MPDINAAERHQPEGNGKVVRLRNPKDRPGTGAGLWAATILGLGAADALFTAAGKVLFGADALMTASFWCMALLIIFGLAWGYLWRQVPRSRGGAEMTAPEIDQAISEVDLELRVYMRGEHFQALLRELSSSRMMKPRGRASALIYTLYNDLELSARFSRIESSFEKAPWLKGSERKKLLSLLKARVLLERRKSMLGFTRSLLGLWSALNPPISFLTVMIVLIHAAVYYLYGL